MNTKGNTRAWLVIAMFLFALAASVMVMTNRPQTSQSSRQLSLPEWVSTQVTWFDNNSTRYAWQQPFAWGTGSYMTRPMAWFAYTNTDGYLQINMSVVLGNVDLKKITALKDSYNRSWEILTPPDTSTDFAPQTMTWIGASNDWAFMCNDDACNRRTSLNQYITTLNTATEGRLRMRVVRYLLNNSTTTTRS